MTCKDCIHNKACSGFTPTDLDSDVFDYAREGRTDEIPDIEERCSSFADKSRFLELPCKVGDRAYVDADSWFRTFIHYEHDFIHSKFFVIGEVVSITKTRKQLLFKVRVLTKDHRLYAQKRFPVSTIGKTVFFSREDIRETLAGNKS